MEEAKGKDDYSSSDDSEDDDEDVRRSRKRPRLDNSETRGQAPLITKLKDRKQAPFNDQRAQIWFSQDVFTNIGDLAENGSDVSEGEAGAEIEPEDHEVCSLLVLSPLFPVLFSFRTTRMLNPKLCQMRMLTCGTFKTSTLKNPSKVHLKVGPCPD
jgi:hypothetical protein